MKEIIPTGIIECPVPGCKRGMWTDMWWIAEKYICPTHHIGLSPTFIDQQGKKYRIVHKFGNMTGGDAGIDKIGDMQITQIRGE